MTTRSAKHAVVGDQVISVNPFKQCENHIPKGSIHTILNVYIYNKLTGVLSFDLGLTSRYTSEQFEVIVYKPTISLKGVYNGKV